ncbi:hypothetical protein CHGG_01543 [Chaetomium globosum CBS 148.51]|uniref:Uncharacterized protein n=1 Tax=Chaetomium globosum (strain ATCC 6205 / CBS 148.51 / DSM 1962 / NBRC 6347 / NRRL 1970) TaxID=306901 RepID=Q2HE11_CHAGB|nr:uncharacterized protein CHGG_01543 [Chaetomium globosum CBS 148.51]EAQ93308.1 hypothetical protein CHGG_01543 [Chaetomium globosum CBS 148.51]
MFDESLRMETDDVFRSSLPLLRWPPPQRQSTRRLSSSTRRRCKRRPMRPFRMMTMTFERFRSKTTRSSTFGVVQDW